MPRLLCGVIALLLCVPHLVLAEEVGEFSIRSVQALQPEQIERLQSLVRSDPEAATLAKAVSDEVTERKLLSLEPQPLRVIRYEGLVNTASERIATVEKLKQMDDVALLVRHWQLTGDEATADVLKRFVLAWSSTYEPTGNDVNENKLFPLLVAYELLRKDMTDEERAKVDPWIEQLGKLHAKGIRQGGTMTNRYTKRLGLLAVMARTLDKPEWTRLTEDGIRAFVSQSLFPDGTSVDLKRRDTLTYHASALRPVLQLAMVSGDAGRSLYAWESDRGGSLKKSVDYVVPYALGEKTREEWTNTTVGLDRRRAEAGLEKYQPGSLYDPQNALGLMEDASYFDPTLLRVVRHLTQSDAERYPTWQTLVNAACRPS